MSLDSFDWEEGVSCRLSLGKVRDCFSVYFPKKAIFFTMPGVGDPVYDPGFGEFKIVGINPCNYITKVEDDIFRNPTVYLEKERRSV